MSCFASCHDRDGPQDDLEYKHHVNVLVSTDSLICRTGKDICARDVHPNYLGPTNEVDETTLSARQETCGRSHRIQPDRRCVGDSEELAKSRADEEGVPGDIYLEHDTIDPLAAPRY